MTVPVAWRVFVGATTDAQEWTLAGATIRYGRSVWYDQPDPPTMVADLLATRAGSRVPLPDLEDAVTVDAVLDAGEPTEQVLRRFTGRIVAVTYEPPYYRIDCAGTGERLNRAWIGDTPWPAETEKDRLRRILTDASVPFQLDGHSRVTFQPRDVDRRNAGELARGYAEQCAGILTETRDGQVLFLTAQRLSRPPRTLTPSPDTVTVTDWRSTMEAGPVVNTVAVSWGPPVEGTGQQDQVTETNAASVARFGERYERINTDLAEAADAREYAQAYLANRGTPYWQLPSVTVRLDLETDPADVVAAASTVVGDLVHLPGAPAGAPYDTYTGMVQGWVEVTGPEWTITYDLARSDTRQLGTVVWSEPTSLYTWAAQTVAWQNANTLDDLVSG